jgi:threonine/homoserine/homoserine lactone efflux protein
MLDTTKVTLFIIAAIGLLLVPGPSVLYIVTRSVSQGRAAGVVSVLGIAAASLIHIAAASLGLSAILLSSALAFSVVKYLGAAYLIFIGLRQLFKKEEAQAAQAVKPQSLRRIFSQGFAVNLLNPKTALFFFAFLPQFVNLNGGNVSGQILLLGGLFVGMALITDGTYALLASLLADRLRNSQRFSKVQRYAAGLVYIGLGLTTAFSGSASKS